MAMKYLKTSEVGVKLHYSQQKIRDLIKKGEFPNAKKLTPRRYIIPEEDVDNFFKKPGKMISAYKPNEHHFETVTLDSWLIKHFGDLEKTAEILVHQCRRLLRYKDNANIKARGDVITKLLFWNEQTREFVAEGISSEDYKESKYEDEHPVDPYLAELLYIHYEGQFGKLPFSAWNQVSIISISPEIVENLNILAHGGLKQCNNCPICSKIVG
jgi:predicted DNA-binding transcriptional regulator AlpA